MSILSNVRVLRGLSKSDPVFVRYAYTAQSEFAKSTSGSTYVLLARRYLAERHLDGTVIILIIRHNRYNRT